MQYIGYYIRRLRNYPSLKCGYYRCVFSGWCFTHQYKNTTQFCFYAVPAASQNTKATIFVGYPCKFRVRSGSSGLKNIYLDVYDTNENVTSIAFISDGDKALIYSVNREEIWRAKL